MIGVWGWAWLISGVLAGQAGPGKTDQRLLEYSRSTDRSASIHSCILQPEERKVSSQISKNPCAKVMKRRKGRCPC